MTKKKITSYIENDPIEIVADIHFAFCFEKKNHPEIKCVGCFAVDEIVYVTSYC